MKLKSHLDFRKIFTILYVASFLVYVFIGLQPADASSYDISGYLSIPSIGLKSDVTTLTLNNHKLDTPDTIVGSFTKSHNKTFLIGHSSTVFQNLNRISLNDIITYNDTDYQVISIRTIEKSKIDMEDILREEAHDTLIIMTCAGEILDNNDATHRLIVTALRK